MAKKMASDSTETKILLRRAERGDRQAVGELFTRHKDRLKRMLKLRLDRRLQGRIDPSDVLQEAYLSASRSLAEYLKNPTMPFFLWLRMIAGRRLHTLHKRHLGTRGRNAGREVALHHGAFPQASSASLAAQLLGRLTTPSVAAMRIELQMRVQEVLNSMEPLDREVLALRHFERLTNAETAAVLDISDTAASNRFVRALARLRDILMTAPGFFEPDAGDKPH